MSFTHSLNKDNLFSLSMKDIFEWNRIFFNGLPAEFIFEVIFRSIIMFLALLLILKFTGRRGIKQLSIFELVIIITLGSAAGDPMFYEDVGIIPALFVFITILFLYRIITWAISKSQTFEEWTEGKTLYIIEDGKFRIEVFEKENIAIDEFFSQLRQKNVEHLGQLKLVLLETSGEISIFFFEDKDVKPGLPILPHVYENCFEVIPEEKHYACTFCGTVENLKPANHVECKNCKKDKWVYTVNSKRVV